MKYFLPLFILTLFCFVAKANDNLALTENELLVLTELENNQEFNLFVYDEAYEEKTPVKFKRGKAILFTVFTGLFGGHRVYFGTHHRTPIIYSITLGGLGILPLVDLVNIIFTKDLSKFDNKTQIIMWGN